MTTEQKLAKLNELLQECGSVIIGFSGGVDSTFLAAAAHRVLGDKALAVTASSATLPASEKQEAAEYAALIGIRHVVAEISELDSPAFVANEPDRCYHCKKTRFSLLVEWAHKQGYEWVLDGSNADDMADYRPGMKAVEELAKVRSPLLEVGFTKQEIRQVLKEWGIPAWNKLSAACLSSRIAYGLPVTEERLRQVEAAESFVRRFCSGQVRVRHHNNLARIEVSPQDIPALAKPETAVLLEQELKKLGFTYVTLDLGGYKTGSMNAAL